MQTRLPLLESFPPAPVIVNISVENAVLKIWGILSIMAVIGSTDIQHNHHIKQVLLL